MQIGILMMACAAGEDEAIWMSLSISPHSLDYYRGQLRMKLEKSDSFKSHLNY